MSGRWIKPQKRDKRKLACDPCHHDMLTAPKPQDVIQCQYSNMADLENLNISPGTIVDIVSTNGTILYKLMAKTIAVGDDAGRN